MIDQLYFFSVFFSPATVFCTHLSDNEQELLSTTAEDPIARAASPTANDVPVALPSEAAGELSSRNAVGPRVELLKQSVTRSLFRKVSRCQKRFCCREFDCSVCIVAVG